LRHYTGTEPELCSQSFVLFTNYQRYIDEFAPIGKGGRAAGAAKFIEPGGRPTAKAPCPPAQPWPSRRRCRLSSGAGQWRRITLSISGVGQATPRPSPIIWRVAAACVADDRPIAGLAPASGGDYVLAHGYLRDDEVLDEMLPRKSPCPRGRSAGALAQRFEITGAKARC